MPIYIACSSTDHRDTLLVSEVKCQNLWTEQSSDNYPYCDQNLYLFEIDIGL